MLKIALVSMPWSAFNRPSIQLGALKSFVEQETSAQVRCYHPCLETAKSIGTDLYHHISLNSWISEALYGAIIFPERRDEIRKLVVKEQSRGKIVFDFDQVVDDLQNQLNEWLAGVDWQGFDLVGFSLCFNQILASLAASILLKERCKKLPIVFGGSSCFPEMAEGLFRHFPIDYMIVGEGEEALVSLVAHLAGDGILNNRVLAASDGSSMAEDLCQINMAELPIPDYRDYFKEVSRVFSGQTFIPSIPLEFSRGCWWGKCVFCNLNLQWQGYRHKSVRRMIEEVESLSQTHESLDFFFTDNVLPYKDGREFFNKVPKQSYSFFAEIRANQGGDYLADCSRGGLDIVQAGIEAFSNSLLQKLDKGTSVIDNVAIMRDGVACGVLVEGNLIIDFPGSTAGEVAETLDCLEYVWPYNPLSTASFFLGHGSPMAEAPRDYSILTATHHINNKKIFPEKIIKDLPMMIKGYRGDQGRQRRLWSPVVAKVRQWQSFHKNRGRGERSLLSWRDGGNFLIIRQQLADGRVLHHRIRGLSRRIYLFCQQVKTMAELEQQFNGLDKGKLLAFIDSLADKRLMFRQEDRVLALAVCDKQ